MQSQAWPMLAHVQMISTASAFIGLWQVLLNRTATGPECIEAAEAQNRMKNCDTDDA